jgi:hypothetical protein
MDWSMCIKPPGFRNAAWPNIEPKVCLMSFSRVPHITQSDTCVATLSCRAYLPSHADVSSSSEWAAKTPSTHWDTAASTHWDKASTEWAKTPSTHWDKKRSTHWDKASTEWAKTPSTHWDKKRSTHWDKASTVSTHRDSTEWAALLTR